MWQEQSNKGMSAFIDGDESLAMVLWRKALELAVDEKAESSLDFGQTSFYFGKVLCDSKQFEECLPHLQNAVRVLTAHDGERDQKDKALYVLAHAYRQLGREDEYNELYVPPKPKKTLPLLKAIKAIQKQKLAQNLTDAVLDNLCSTNNIDKADSGDSIYDLLYHYYTDSASGVERRSADKYFTHVTSDFVIEDVVDTLAELLGKPGKIKIDENVPMSENEDSVGLILSLGKSSSFHEVTGCVDHIVWCVNELLEESGAKVRFQRLDGGPENQSSYYLLKESALEKLSDSDALSFIDCDNYD